MFHFDRVLKLTTPDLAIDSRRRQARAFISHAHYDHMARHELAFCTPATAALYQHRYGRRDVKEMPYRQTIEWGGVALTTYPAGHCLGAAMLLVEENGRRLLYTGDFKLEESATAERAELPKADILVMECTYGDPKYRLPPRDVVIAELIQRVREAFRAGATPVIQAYALGKGQEVTKLLTDHGIGVLQHKDIFAISQVYQRCGVELGNFQKYPGRPLEGHAVVVPPRSHRSGELRGLKRTVHLAVTGWAANGDAARRWGVDYAIPLSDHADFDQLLAAVEQVGAEEVYCVHGPEVAEFAKRLQDAGHHAQPLESHGLKGSM